MELVTIGKIYGSHHLKGACKVSCILDDLDSLINDRVVVTLKSNENIMLTMRTCEHTFEDKWIVTFDEITNKTEAMNVSGGYIKVRKDLIPDIEENLSTEGLIGMKAVDNETDEVLGLVADYYTVPLYDVLNITNDEYEMMVPNTDVFVTKIDHANKRIYINVLDGMKEYKKK